MRDIQERAIEARTAIQTIQQRLETRQLAELGRDFQFTTTRPEAVLRVTSLPIEGSVILPRRVYQYGFDQIPQLMPCKVSSDSQPRTLRLREVDPIQEQFRPDVRAAFRRRWTLRQTEGRTETLIEYITEDGLVESLHPVFTGVDGVDEWTVMTVAAHNLKTANTVRQLAGVPGAELAVVVEGRGYSSARHGLFGERSHFMLPQVVFFRSRLVGATQNHLRRPA